MSDLPGKITIVEEGVREGCQIQVPPIPTADKLELISALSETGLAKIQVASMVNPARVPGWADAETVLEHLPTAPPGVRYSAVWLNEKGFDRAWRFRHKLHFEGAFSGCASETFLLKNQNRTIAQNLIDQRENVRVYADKGVSIERVAVMAAFGCNFEGDIPVSRTIGVLRGLLDLADETGRTIRTIILADTMAWATPFSIKTVVGAVREQWPDKEIALHLHDTRGMGIANAYAGLEMGVSRFDASVAGLGGCPCAGHAGAAGNVCTEDLVFLAHEAGIETGVDLDKLIDVALMAEQIFDRPLSGSVMKGGNLDRFRKV